MVEEIKEEHEHKEHHEHKHHEHRHEEHHKPEGHKSEAKQEHEKVHHEHPKHKKPTGLNAWKLSTAVIAILLIISIFTAGFGLKSSTTRAVLTKEEAANKAIGYINDNLLQEGMAAKLGSVEEKNDLYFIKMDIAGREYESYITKDGSYLFPSGFDLDKEIEQPELPEQETPTVEKSDKPVVELFVMSFCPYGVKAQEILVPVAKLFEDKIDTRVRFVYYAMHGKKEIDENLMQYCIQEEEPKKYWDYLECFVKSQNTEPCLSEAKVNKNKVDKCIEDTDKEFKITEKYNDQSTWLSGKYPLFDIEKEVGDQYGVQGSESLIINGVKISASEYRWDPNKLKTIICNAFTNATEECNQEISSSGSSSETTSGSCG